METVGQERGHERQENVTRTEYQGDQDVRCDNRMRGSENKMHKSEKTMWDSENEMCNSENTR